MWVFFLFLLCASPFFPTWKSSQGYEDLSDAVAISKSSINHQWDSSQLSTRLLSCWNIHPLLYPNTSVRSRSPSTRWCVKPQCRLQTSSSYHDERVSLRHEASFSEYGRLYYRSTRVVIGVNVFRRASLRFFFFLLSFCGDYRRFQVVLQLVTAGFSLTLLMVTRERVVKLWVAHLSGESQHMSFHLFKWTEMNWTNSYNTKWHFFIFDCKTFRVYIGIARCWVSSPFFFPARPSLQLSSVPACSWSIYCHTGGFVYQWEKNSVFSAGWLAMAALWISYRELTAARSKCTYTTCMRRRLQTLYPLTFKRNNERITHYLATEQLRSQLFNYFWWARIKKRCNSYTVYLIRKSLHYRYRTPMYRRRRLFCSYFSMRRQKTFASVNLKRIYAVEVYIKRNQMRPNTYFPSL